MLSDLKPLLVHRTHVRRVVRKGLQTHSFSTIPSLQELKRGEVVAWVQEGSLNSMYASDVLVCFDLGG